MTTDEIQAHVDDLIDEWHEGAEHYPGQPLRDYLKMTDEQYARLVENRGFADDYVPPPLGRTWGEPDSTDISRAIGQPGPCRPMAEFILICLLIGCVLALVVRLLNHWEGR